MTNLLKITGDAWPRIEIDKLVHIAITILRYPLIAGRFGKYSVKAAFRAELYESVSTPMLHTRNHRLKMIFYAHGPTVNLTIMAAFVRHQSYNWNPR